MYLPSSASNAAFVPAFTYGGPMQRRGRSRQVSHVAIARQASEERRLSPQSRLYLRATIPDLPPPPPPLLTPPSLTITRSPSIRRTVSPPQPVPLPTFLDATLLAKPDPDDRYYDSPPSPPRSLSDQVHVAYALENMHLAKILLLKLKGIEITSDDDPRIDEVKDEDFDVCFLPDVGRRLRLEEEDETRLEKMRRKQEEMILVSREEELRRENLRKCEVVWQDAKIRLREAKEHATRRRAKEDEYRRRKEAEDMRGRVAEENTRLQLQRRARITQSKLYPRGVVSYTTFSELNQSPVDISSTYDAMPIVPSPSNSLTRQILTSNPPPPPQTETVSFKDVVRSMEGALFPIEPPPTSTTTSRASSLHQPQPPLTSSLTYTSTPEGRRKRRQGQLLEGLLKVVEWEAGERRQTKGKGKSPNTNEGVLLRRGSSNTGYCAACAHAAAPSSLPSGSGISKISRASSWLSFSSTGSSSSRSSSSLSSSSSSASTAPTSPSTSTSTSPITSWLKKPNASFSSLALADPRASPPSHHSCHRLTPVDLAHTPLGPDLSPSSTSSSSSSPASRHANRNNASRSGVKPQGGGQTLVRRMSKLVELAKGFQEAYITFSITSYDAFDDRHHLYTSSSLSQPPPRPTTKKPKPAGYRASPSDISIFIPPPSTSTSPSTSLSLCTSIQPPTAPTYIPLICPFPPPPHPKTSLPHPLPYPTFFKPIPLLSRSPLRRLGSVGWRIRPLANPVYLRLRALQNLMWERGINFDVTKSWDLGGGGGLVNGNLGLTPLMAAGRERICGIACEGIGRSGLGVEVRLW